jgi:hypothetical protein
MPRKFFHGYIILALCFVNLVAMRGLNGSYGVYYLALWKNSPGPTAARAWYLSIF